MTITATVGGVPYRATLPAPLPREAAPGLTEELQRLIAAADPEDAEVVTLTWLRMVQARTEEAPPCATPA